MITLFLALFFFVSPIMAFVSGHMKTLGRSIELSESKADLEVLASELNPKIGFFDPLDLSSAVFWGGDEKIWNLEASNEATIGFLRHAEIKHGRVAMAAFVGYLVQAGGFHWPWAMTLAGSQFPIAELSPEAQWVAIPLAAKAQIISFVGILELWSEAAGDKHYMMGGKPGYFPPFKGNTKMQLPHPVPFNLYDPFGFIEKKATDESKAKGLVKEINNGRLAMIGIMAFVAESKVPGAVPFLAGKITQFDGNVMAPFANDVIVPPI